MAQKDRKRVETDFSRLVNGYMSKRRDLDFERFAAAIGIHHTTLGKQLNHGQFPRSTNCRDEINAIARVCGLTDEQRDELLIAAKCRSDDDTDLKHRPLLDWPKSDVPESKPEPFLRFHKNSIEELVRRLSWTSSRENKVIVLHGALGAGKRRIALDVAARLKERANTKEPDSPAIYHVIDHLTDDDDRDISRAVNSLIERIAISLHIPITQSIKEQKEEILEKIDNYHYKLVICGLHPKISTQFFDFLADLRSAARILITYPYASETISYNKKNLTFEPHELRAVNPDNINDVRDFLIACDVGELTEENIRNIGERTKGDSFALRQVANLLTQSENFADRESAISNALANVLSLPLEEQIQELTEEELILLKGHSLFKTDADRLVLSRIAWPNLLPKDREAKFDSVTDKLCRRGVVAKSEISARFTMEEPYRTHIWQEFLDRDVVEKRTFKRRWTRAYLELRTKEDIVEWASTTDYEPDDGITVHYSSEIGTLIDVVRYCLSQNRSNDPIDDNDDNSTGNNIYTPSYWCETAARILSNFRANFFASAKWEVTTELCEIALKQLQTHNPNSPLSADMHRQIARLDCFQDKYDQSSKRLEKAQALAIKGIQQKATSESDKSFFRAIYYRTLITFGDVALRKANQAKNWWRFFKWAKEIFQSDLKHYNAIEAIETGWLREAGDAYENAKGCFNRAKGFVEAEFPLEIPFANYYLAETDYYSRDTVGHWRGQDTVKRGHRQPYEEVNLDASHTAFDTVMATWESYFGTKVHNRLSARVDYYQGKIHQWQKKYSEAERLLLEAQIRANKFNDSILSAHIKFALGQLHSDIALKADKSAAEKEIEKFRDNMGKALIALNSFGMQIEVVDAIAFSLRRKYEHEIEMLNIPSDLIELFREHCKQAITHHYERIAPIRPIDLADTILSKLLP